MLTKNLPEGLHFFPTAQVDKVVTLWRQFSQTSGIFDDIAQNDITSFLQMLHLPNAVWLELDDESGVIYATSIVEGLSAYIHAAVFNHRLRERHKLFVEFLAWLVTTCSLVKINAALPSFAHAAQRHLKKIGFQQEGVLRRFSRSRGGLYNLNIYGILSEEVLTHPLLRKEI